MALGVIPNASGSEAAALADLKADLDEEKAAQVTPQVEADVHPRIVHDLKILPTGFPPKSPLLKTWLS
jgi:hypothetical protein